MTDLIFKPDPTPAMRMEALQMAYASLDDHDEPLCHIAAIQVSEEILEYVMNGTVPKAHPGDDMEDDQLTEDLMPAFVIESFRKKYGDN